MLSRSKCLLHNFQEEAKDKSSKFKVFILPYVNYNSPQTDQLAKTQ